MTSRRNFLERRGHIKATKRERQNVLARFWSKPTPHEIVITDKEDHLKISCPNENIAAWWIGIFKAAFPQDNCSGDGNILKIRPEVGVALKVDQKDGTLRVTGKKHFAWFSENFEQLLDNAIKGQRGENRVAAVLDKQLGLDDGVEDFDLLKELPRSGAIKNNIFIYRLWKAMLHKWLSSGGEVTVVTPIIDARRLAVIYLMAIRNHTANFQLRLGIQEQKTDGKNRFKKVQQDAIDMIQNIKALDGKKQFITKDKLRWALDTVNIKFLAAFNCNFISAFLEEDHNEVLSTTARFHKNHFDVDRCDTINFAKLTDDGLNESYLEPLGIFKTTFLHDNGQIDYGTIRSTASHRLKLSASTPTLDMKSYGTTERFRSSPRPSIEAPSIEARRPSIDNSIDLPTLGNAYEASYDTYSRRSRNYSLSNLDRDDPFE